MLQKQRGVWFHLSQQCRGCRAAPAPLETKSKKGLHIDSLKTVLCLCSKTAVLFLEQLNICISLICKLGLVQMSFFLLLCAQLAFLCIILFNETNTYSHPVDIGYNSLAHCGFVYFPDFCHLAF